MQMFKSESAFTKPLWSWGHGHPDRLPTIHVGSLSGCTGVRGQTRATSLSLVILELGLKEDMDVGCLGGSVD